MDVPTRAPKKEKQKTLATANNNSLITMKTKTIQFRLMIEINMNSPRPIIAQQTQYVHNTWMVC